MQWVEVQKDDKENTLVLVNEDNMAILGVSKQSHNGLWCAYSYGQNDEEDMDSVYFIDKNSAMKYCDKWLNTHKL